MNKSYATIYSNHFGKIMSNLSIFGVVLMAIILLGSVLAFSFYAFALFLAFALVIFSLGLVFAMSPNLIHDMISFNDSIPKITAVCFKAFPYIFGVTVMASILSLVFLCIEKHNRSTSRIVFASVVLGLTLILGLIFLVVGVGE